jgi:putative ABC transport system permease protein
MTQSKRTPRFRFWLGLIALIGVIVPRRLRADWRQEWEAELRFRETLLADWDRLNWRARLDLLHRSLGAFWDALVLQPRRVEDEMFQDLRYGIRMLLKKPGFTLIAVLTLALGIGATTAIFSVVNAVLLRPLPYKDPDRLMMVRETKLPEIPESQISAATFIDWQEQNTVFEQLEAIFVSDVNLTGETNPEWLHGMCVTSGFFSMLGTPPQIGRDFLSDEQSRGHSNVAIISYALWQRQFGGNPDILNQTITLDDRSFTVVGVMPANSGGLHFRDPDVWMPLALTAEQVQKRDVRTLFPLGRVKPGVTLERAHTEMSLIADRLARQYPDSNGGWDVRITPLLEYAVSGMKPALLLMLGAVAFVLLITCTNVANLLLARAAARQKEIAVRSALGAGRWRIVRQLLTESVMLSLAGGIMGSALAIWGMEILLALVPDWYKPRVLDVSLDGRVLFFTIAITVLTGISFGLVPALQASNPNLNEMLKDAGRGSTEGRRQQLVRNTLVVLEVAMSLVLLVGAGLMIKSFILLQKVDPGFDPNHALTVSLSLPENKYPDKNRQAAFYEQLIERVSTLPGVQAAGASSSVPFSYAHFGVLGGSFKFEGEPPYQPGHEPGAVYFSVSPDYFKAMGIALLRGRVFTAQDRKGAPPVAIINATMARQFFPEEHPIGKRIHISVGVTNGPEVYREIIGVVRDVKHSLDQETPWPQIYEPCAQQPFPFMTLVVRTAGDPSGLNEAIREEVLTLDKEQPIFSMTTLGRLVSTSTEQQQFSVLLFGVFAAVAVVLAAVGLYGVMSYGVSQRTHEIGIRMALGAQREHVLGLIMRQGIKLTLSGIAFGLLAAWMVTRLLTALLYGVSVTDPLTFVGVSLLLISVALLACYVPARRATMVDPMIALRHD